MRLKLFFLASLLCGVSFAQSSDPVIMTVNGAPVSRSEFEYSFNKNNSEGVIDKKSVDEYVDLFINYKLKVVAALDAHLDTLTSFKNEFASYRDQQIRPTMVTDEDVLAEAHKVYDNTKASIGQEGLFRAAHIFIHLDQKAKADEQTKAKNRIDSLYNVLKKGGDFSELAKKYSEDRGSAAQGGLLPWLRKSQTLKEFEDQAFRLKPGQMSKPFLSPAGYHIILMKDRKPLDPFDSLKTNIINFIEQRGVREQIVNQKLDTLVKQSGGKITKEDVLSHRADSLSAIDSDLKYLIREYHDGLLLVEISNRNVWEKASKDEPGLEKYFKKNKKKYAWTSPRFKGIVFHVKKAEDVDAVKKSVKGLPFDQWTSVLRKTFNNDSVIRVRVDKGIFKAGDNVFVDKLVFKKDTAVTAIKDYPIDGYYGKLLKKGPKEYSDVRGLVTADYQQVLEDAWIKDLRAKYPVVVNKEVLATVNKHSK
jgi:peptidyl-prolyl cis-trans isomerase SurA